MKAITASVIITNLSTRADGSLGVKLVTPELSADEKLALIQLQNIECKILIQPKEGATEELKEIKGEFDKKSPSSRIRSTLFVLWKHLTETQQIETSFETFYLRQCESYLDSLKKQLPGIH